MSSEKDLDRRIVKAGMAKNLLDDLTNEIVLDMAVTVYQNWKSSPAKNVEEREDLNKMAKTVDAFVAALGKRIDDGKVAKSQKDQSINGDKGYARIRR